MNLSLKHYRIIKNHYKICIYIDFKLLTDKDDIFLKCPSSFNDSKKKEVRDCQEESAEGHEVITIFL